MKEFPLFSRNSEFTDDSVMTLAVADAFLSLPPEASEVEIRRFLVRSMQTYGRKYPYAGYGGMFHRWLRDTNPPALRQLRQRLCHAGFLGCMAV